MAADGVGRWRFIERLGAGAMGEVYLASDGARTAAVKLIAPGLASDPTFRTRFQREIEICRRVRGPQVAELFDADPDGDPPWLALAYVPGPTLAQAVAQHGPLHGHALRGFAIAALEGLRQIHMAGVVHRDLKPANVILTPSTPVIIDFGIAVLGDATSLTAAGMAVGSAGWMAPEQLRGGPVGPAADVFAWGGLVTFAATGHGPFGVGPAGALAYRVVNEEPDLEDVPQELVGIVGSTLRKDSSDRPTLTHLLVELDAPSGDAPTQIATLWHADGAVTEFIEQNSPPVAQEPVSHRRLSISALIAFGLVVAMAAIITVLALRPTEQAAETADRGGRPSTSTPASPRTTDRSPATSAGTVPPTTAAVVTTTTVPPVVLAPATVPPRGGLCTEQLSYGANGTAAPLFCADGSINRLAWEWYARDNPATMGLGPLAQPDLVRSALCSDLFNASFPIMDAIYQLSEAYYGWSFGIPANDVLTDQMTADPSGPQPCDQYLGD